MKPVQFWIENLVDFRFWNLDFGLRTSSILDYGMFLEPKSKIPNPHSKIPTYPKSTFQNLKSSHRYPKSHRSPFP